MITINNTFTKVASRSMWKGKWISIIDSLLVFYVKMFQVENNPEITVVRKDHRFLVAIVIVCEVKGF